MAKLKLYNVLKKYNDNHVLNVEKQKENNDSLVDFETFATLSETKVNELVNSVKENVNVGNLSFALGSLGGSTIAQKKDAIDAAAGEFNYEQKKEAGKKVFKEAADVAKRKAAIKNNAKFQVANLLKIAAKKVIEETRKEAEISGKKPSFADITYKATKNQKEREESFRVFAAAGNDKEARKMLFEGEHPMPITPRFVEFMEEKYPDSPALKLLYEKQLKTELDRAVIGRQASKETIVNLSEKLSPGAINDVMIDGKPMLTYVALNNPGIIDRVSNIEGISAASKKTALIAVANRSRDRRDYNAAIDLVASGAQAKVDDLTISLDASSANVKDIANLVTISSSTMADRRTLKNTMNQQVADLENKQKLIDDRNNRKNVRKDTIAGAKVVGEGLSAAAIGTAGILAAPFILVGVGALKLSEHLSENKYMKRSAAFLGKKIVKGALHSPQAIAAAVSLTVGSAAVAIYYNSAKLSNAAKQSLGHAKGALHSPVELARRMDLRSELNKSDKFMQNMITKEFKELYEEGKKEIGVDKKDKKAYEAAKDALKKALDIRKDALKDELKEQNSKHQERIKALIQGKFKDPETGLIVRDRQQREEIIQNELRIIAGEKLAFFDELYRGQSNYESIKRQEAILEENKQNPITSLADLGDRLEGKGSNRDTVEEFISRFDNVGDALKAMESNIKIQGARHKDYEVLAAESDKVTEKAMAATKSMATGVSRAIDNSTTASLLEVDYQTQWNSVKDFAKGVYNTHNIPWEMAKNAVKAKPELVAENSGIELIMSPLNSPAPANYVGARGNSVSSNSTISEEVESLADIGSVSSPSASKKSGLTAEALYEHNRSTPARSVSSAGEHNEISSNAATARGRDYDSKSDISDLSFEWYCNHLEQNIKMWEYVNNMSTNPKGFISENSIDGSTSGESSENETANKESNKRRLNLPKFISKGKGVSDVSSIGSSNSLPGNKTKQTIKR